MTWVEGPFCTTIILQTTSIFASNFIPTQLTKPVNARKNCSRRVKTRGLYVKTPAMGTYLLKKYEHQFYRSRPNPYSGKAVNIIFLPLIDLTLLMWFYNYYSFELLHKNDTLFSLKPLFRWCPQAQFFHIKTWKHTFPAQKKGTFVGLAGIALSRGRDIPGY